MKNKLFSLFLAGVAVLGVATTVSAQVLQLGSNDNPVTVPDPNTMNLSIISDSGVVQSGISPAMVALQPAGGSLQTFTYNITATKDGNPYSGVIVGRSPYLRGKIPTQTTVQVIPLVITFTATGDVFDPRAPTACSAGHTILELTQNSPIFLPYPRVINGVDVGPAQYPDAFSRAEFWSLINGANYHTELNPMYPGTIFINIGPSAGYEQFIGCTGDVGFIDLNQWDPFLQSAVIPLAQSAFGVNATQFAFFLVSNVYYYIGQPNNCCVLGYHNAYQMPIQTYSPTTLDTTGIFGDAGQDTAVMAHEVDEWINDPYVNNATPAWGGIGQVGGCQGNLEVGDALTGTQTTPVPGVNGWLYHVQELVFFSWFFNDQFTPSLGAGGLFSGGPTTNAGGHAVFAGPSKVCPPGGTF